MTTEESAMRAWQDWGYNWSLFTTCSKCKEMKQCRGKSKRLLLCLDCWDQR